MSAAWAMNEFGEFELQEPYQTMLHEATMCATRGWRDALLDYVEPRSRYSREQLSEGLTKMCLDENRTAIEKLDDFVIRALEGDL